MSLPFVKLPRTKNPTNFISTNKIYAGMHRMTRSAIANKFHNASIKMVKQVPADFSGVLMLVFKYKKKRSTSDNSNLSFMGKMLEDSLVKHNVIRDDKQECVTEIRYRYLYEKDCIECCEAYFIEDTFDYSEL